jgi:hypothetical protein
MRNIHNQVNYILIDGRLHSSVLYVQLFRAADFDTDHNLVVAKVRERLAQISYGVVQSKEIKQYHVEISNRFTALQNLGTEVNINSAWETVRENIRFSVKESLGYYELKNKLWFDEEC